MSKKNQSGWYTSEQGNPFHAHGHNMDEETIKAIGALADAAAKNLGRECPQCGNHWLSGLEWNQDQGWHCSCGWIGDFEEQANENNN